MDILTTWDLERGDWLLASPGLAEDEGLKTAIIISLFSDRRANADDVLPNETGDRRGWFGDNFAAVDGDQIGSRLWLLSREKQMPNVLLKAREYCVEALQWMIQDGVAKSVDVVAEVFRPGVLAVYITISKPNGNAQQFKFENNWIET